MQTHVSTSLSSYLTPNVHAGLDPPAARAEPVTAHVEPVTVRGDYWYFHYGCDGLDDRGWGCGYRTVQTVASWLLSACTLPRGRDVPSLPDMQRALVSLGDKPESFCGSRDWIGTVEAALVLDHFYDVQCKIAHVRKGDLERAAAEELREHFRRHGSPVMMGGGADHSSKAVLGVSGAGARGCSLLVLDPHYHGPRRDRAELQRRGWVTWTRLADLDHSSFYNLCLPQTGPFLRTSYLSA